MKNKGLYIRLSESELSAFKAKAKKNGLTLSAWLRFALLGVADFPEVFRETEKAKESLSVPTVQRLEKEFSPAVDPSRCEGGFHCPMSAVIQKKGKWLCEHHSK